MHSRQICPATYEFSREKGKYAAQGFPYSFGSCWCWKEIRQTSRRTPDDSTCPQTYKSATLFSWSQSQSLPSYRPLCWSSCWCSSPSWCNVTELNSSNGSTSSPLGVAQSRGTPLAFANALLPLISTLSLSFTFRKLGVSVPFPWCGIMGGFMWRIKAHCVWRKNGWLLTSEAPARAPRRRFSSFIRSFRTRDLQRLFNVSQWSAYIANCENIITWRFVATQNALGMGHRPAEYSQTSRYDSSPWMA